MPLDYSHVMANEQEGEIEFFLQVHQQVAHLRLDRDIKRRHAFGCNDNFRIKR